MQTLVRGSISLPAYYEVLAGTSQSTTTSFHPCPPRKVR